MKRNKLVIIFAPFLSVAFIAGCNGNSKMPAITSFVEEKPDVYSYKTKGIQQPIVEKVDAECGLYPIYLINDNSIPYISIKTGVDDLYLNLLAKSPIYEKTLAKYTYETKDNKTTITNGANNSTCVIDYSKQTMEFNDYCAFLNNDINQITPLDKGLTGGRQYFRNIKKEKYVAPKSSYVIDFTKYDIPLFTKDNEGYIPNEVFNNLLTSVSSFDATYMNNKLYFSNEIAANSSDLVNRVALNKTLETNFSDDYMKYCYNLNALTISTNFGLRSRNSRATNGYTINYETDGYAIMSKYGKDKFLYNKGNLANQTFMDLINREYDDGGHTINTDAGFLIDYKPTINYGMESNAYVNYYVPLGTARKNAGYAPTSGIGEFGLFKDKKDTAFLTMDSFVQPSIEDYTTLDYHTNTMSLVYYANNKLNNDDSYKDVKKLVVDLSLNLGGSAFTACFMSSWLTRGKSHFKNACLSSGAFSDYTYQADVNKDGSITEKDFLRSDIDIYVIVTPCSFSCGNLLPCDLRDYTSAKFIGNHSGGGACITRPGFQSGYGSTYQLSSNYAMCRVGADENNLITNDAGAGVENDKGDFPLDLNEPESYYDRDKIYETIHK